ncbi:MAG TPA: XRE family transcriptional regulator [Alphaproteobacteria bacterium]|nr:XRE family transcriptional regulator [Alphaproteobacteria bacterium]
METIIEDSLDTQIAARIRVERDARDWSLDNLAQRSGVSRAMISKVERRESSPTAVLLGKLSAAFGLTLSQLLARAERGHAGLSMHRRRDQRAWRDPETDFERRSLTPPGAATPLELVAGDLPPGASIAYPASAFAMIEDQQIVVLSGRLRFVQGGTTADLSAGDCCRLGPPADCRFENPGNAPCRYIVAVLRRKN